MVVVAEETKLADEMATTVNKEKLVVQTAVNEATEIKEECERDLEEARPALEKAERALEVLEKKDIDELKQMRNPVPTIRKTLQALVMILEGTPPEKKKEGLVNVTDWWAASIRTINRPAILKEITGYNIDDLEEKRVLELG